MLSPSKIQDHENPFASASYFVEPDIDLTGQSTKRPTPTTDNPFAQSPPVSGSIGSSSSARSTPGLPQNNSQAPLDTLDEPVSVTILRDIKKVGNKLKQVLHPKGDRSVLQDWDLWGPLVLCLALAITLSAKAEKDQSVAIFTGVFVIVWIGAAVVTLNAKLLGGAVSFFQSVCVIGYCLFPLVVSAIVTVFVDILWVRIPLSAISFAWATYASVGFLSESQIHLNRRRALAVYPLLLFYLVIAWLVLVS